MDFTYELEQLEKGNKTAKVIQSIIEKHKPRAEQIKNFYERYKASTDGVPIFGRTVKNPHSINNQVNNDFFSEIIDIRTGYFAGNEVSYVVNTEAEDAWQEFYKRNRIADLDSETTKHAGIGGYSTRLMYMDAEDENIRVVILPAWETVLLGDKGIDEPKYGLRYYPVQVSENETEIRAELHEAGKMTEFRGASVETLKLHEEHTNVFDVCPMWGYMNNEELQGEAEKVIKDIDAYDKVMSDVNSEIEAFRSAYLAFFGVEPPDDKEITSFTESGTFYFGEGQDGKFIVKQLQTDAIEAHLDRLHENIYLFTKTPNFRDRKSGNVPTGIALKHMMQPLENKTVAFERKFTSGNLRMFEILASAWGKKKITLKPYEVQQKYTRNFPKDMLYEAQVQAQLKGYVPEEIRLAQFPGIQDVAQAIKDLEREQNDIMQQMRAEQEQIEEKLKQGDE